MLVCHFTTLIRNAEAQPIQDRDRAAAHIAILHGALKAACPKYLSDACFADVPALPDKGAAPAQPAPSTVIVQWRVRDVEDASVLSALQGQTGFGSATCQLSDSEVLALEPAPATACMLFVVVNHEGKLRVGEVSLDVAAVRELLRRTRELRHRLESPKGDKDLFGYAPPSQQELAVVRGAAERLLGKKGPDRPLVADWAPPVAPQQATTPAPPTAGGGTRQGQRDKVKQADQGPAAPSLPPNDVAFLTKLEALLSIDNGVELTDPTFAFWADLVLPKAEGQDA